MCGINLFDLRLINRKINSVYIIYRCHSILANRIGHRISFGEGRNSTATTFEKNLQ